MFVAHLVSYKVRKLNMSWFSGKFFSSRFFRNFNRIAPSRAAPRSKLFPCLDRGRPQASSLTEGRLAKSVWAFSHRRLVTTFYRGNSFVIVAARTWGYSAKAANERGIRTLRTTSCPTPVPRRTNRRRRRRRLRNRLRNAPSSLCARTNHVSGFLKVRRI